MPLLCMSTCLYSMFMKTAIVPIIKNKTGDTSDTINYRPIYIYIYHIHIDKGQSQIHKNNT